MLDSNKMEISTVKDLSNNDPKLVRDLINASPLIRYVQFVNVTIKSKLLLGDRFRLADVEDSLIYSVYRGNN